MFDFPKFGHMHSVLQQDAQLIVKIRNKIVYKVVKFE